MEQTAFPARAAIAVAPNGGRKTRADHPGIPLSPAELARTAAECADAGAAMIHVHVRKPDGSHLLDADAYRDAIAAIRSETGDRLIIQITSEALGVYSPEQQAEVIRQTRPEAVSLALREFVRNDSDLPAFKDLLEWMKQEEVLPQIILYEPSEALRLGALLRHGELPWNDIPVLYVLGRYTTSQTSTPADLLGFIPPQSARFAHWTTCAFGRHETACLTASGLMGGHIRTGFENNMLLPDGSTARSNAELVGAVTDALRACGIAPQSREDLQNALDAVLAG